MCSNDWNDPRIGVKIKNAPFVKSFTPEAGNLPPPLLSRTDTNGSVRGRGRERERRARARSGTESTWEIRDQVSGPRRTYTSSLLVHSRVVIAFPSSVGQPITSYVRACIRRPDITFFIPYFTHTHTRASIRVVRERGACRVNNNYSARDVGPAHYNDSDAHVDSCVRIRTDGRRRPWEPDQQLYV